METIPTTSRSLDRYYHINGDTFEKQYKEVLNGYREWPEFSHAEEWLVCHCSFPSGTSLVSLDTVAGIITVTDGLIIGIGIFTMGLAVILSCATLAL